MSQLSLQIALFTFIIGLFIGLVLGAKISLYLVRKLRQPEYHYLRPGSRNSVFSFLLIMLILLSIVAGVFFYSQFYSADLPEKPMVEQHTPLPGKSDNREEKVSSHTPTTEKEYPPKDTTPATNDSMNLKTVPPAINDTVIKEPNEPLQYYIQLGAGKDLNKVKERSAQLQPYYSQEIQLGKLGSYYKIVLGPYQSKMDAELAKKGIIDDCFIISSNKIQFP